MDRSDLFDGVVVDEVVDVILVNTELFNVLAFLLQAASREFLIGEGGGELNFELGEGVNGEFGERLPVE